MNRNIKYYHSWKQDFGPTHLPGEKGMPEPGILLSLYPDRHQYPDGQLANLKPWPKWLVWARRIIHVLAFLLVAVSLIFGIAAHI